MILNGERAGPYAFGHSSKSRCMLWCLHANQFYSSSTLSASPDVNQYHMYVDRSCLHRDHHLSAGIAFTPGADRTTGTGRKGMLASHLKPQSPVLLLATLKLSDQAERGIAQLEGDKWMSARSQGRGRNKKSTPSCREPSSNSRSHSLCNRLWCFVRRATE